MPSTYAGEPAVTKSNATVASCAQAPPGSITAALTCANKAEAFRQLDEAGCFVADSPAVVEVRRVWLALGSLAANAAARDRTIQLFMAECLVEAHSKTHPADAAEVSAAGYLRSALTDPLLAGSAMVGLAPILTKEDIDTIVMLGSTQSSLALPAVVALSIPCTAEAKSGAAAIQAAYASTQHASDIQRMVDGNAALCDDNGQSSQARFSGEVLVTLLPEDAAVGAAIPLAAGATDRPKIRSEADLPSFSYPMTQSVQALLTSDPATFAVFAAGVKRNLESILRNNDIDDKGILLRLLSDKLDLEMLFGEDAEALKTCEEMRLLVDRPDFKVTGMFNDLSFIRARMATGRSDGEVFQAEYKKDFGSLVESLPWDIVAERVKKSQKKFERLSTDYVKMQVAADIEPYVKEHQALDFPLATKLIFWRGTLLTEVPQRQIVLDILSAYVKKHDPSASPPQ